MKAHKSTANIMFYDHFHICVWDLVDGYKFLFEALWLSRRLGLCGLRAQTHYILRFGWRGSTGCQHSPNDLIESTPPRPHGNTVNISLREILELIGKTTNEISETRQCGVYYFQRGSDSRRRDHFGWKQSAVIISVCLFLMAAFQFWP